MKFLVPILLLLGVFGGLPSPASGDETEPLTLNRAVTLALSNNRTVAEADAKVAEATALRLAAMGRFGPSLRADGTWLHWSAAHEIDVMDYVDLPPAIASLVEIAIGDLDPIEMRADETTQVQLTAVQPLTPLYSVYQGVRARQAGEVAAKKMSEQTKKEITYKTVEAYCRLLSVSKMKEVAQAAVDTIAAHVTQAREFAAQDLIGQREILTAEVELASAQENLIRAQSGVSLASSALAHLLGLSLDAMLDPVDDPAASPGGLPTSLTDARNAAEHGRGEIAALHAKSDAMEALTKLAWWQLTPTLAAIGRYQYSDGIILYDENEMFAGLTLQWNFFEWGRKYNEARAAAAQAQQARFREHEAVGLIHLQVKQKYLELESARKRLEVAQRAVAQAEEVLRISQLRFRESLDTSIDVMDSQTRLTHAQSNHINAQYDLITGAAALRLAMGLNPWPDVPSATSPEDADDASTKKTRRGEDEAFVAGSRDQALH